jgi:hypothetical protein
MSDKKIYEKPQISVIAAISTQGKNINKVENGGHPNGTSGAPRS